ATRQADIDIQAKAEDIAVLTERIAKNRAILARSLQRMYDYDQENMLVVLAKNETLSDFFSALDSIRSLQSQVGELVSELRQTKQEVEREKEALEDFRVEQLSLKALAEIERRAVQGKKAEKDSILKLTRGKEAEFQKILAQKKRDLTALKTQLFYLERTGISAGDALKFAELAASRTGIRTAFLLALLEVETGRQFEGGVISAGTYLGTGNWREDMYNCYLRLGRRSAAEAQKNAFFKITAKLNLDPDKMPVSRRPSYGCGGAMGPAQFIPTTWLLFEAKTASRTGHNPPNPWNIEDAFTASAIFLAEAGAGSKTRAGELAAARTYISGRPSCPALGSARYACLAYANRVLSLAEDIDRVI
ncbi:MAG: lytic murein transglycosylase, partial [Patescibacteria group bacterium]